MNSKYVIIIFVIIILLGVANYFLFFQKQTPITNQTLPISNNNFPASTSSNKIVEPIIQQQTQKTNNFENFQLLKIAKDYILKKPQLYWNREKFVNWNSNELGADFAKTSPEWIVSQKVTIEYNEPNKYKSPYDNLNDKYIVNWFFIPGCEENPNSNARPNWFDKAGLPCVGGYNLTVIINPDGTVNHAELNALD